MACSKEEAGGTGCVKCPRPVLYEQNVAVFNLFTKCLTQFRAGFAGPTGLDYSGVKQVMDITCVEPSEQLFSDIQTLEYAYLEALKDRNAREPASSSET
jgi:hypothetical protein